MQHFDKVDFLQLNSVVIQISVYFFFFRIVATVNRLIILPLFSTCSVCSCFRNPPNSDMNYRILNVRTWSFLYTRGLGTPTDSQHNIFNSEKTHKFSLCSWRGSNLGSWNLRVRRSNHWGTPPFTLFNFFFFFFLREIRRWVLHDMLGDHILECSFFLSFSFFFFFQFLFSFPFFIIFPCSSTLLI